MFSGLAICGATSVPSSISHTSPARAQLSIKGPLCWAQDAQQKSAALWMTMQLLAVQLLLLFGGALAPQKASAD